MSVLARAIAVLEDMEDTIDKQTYDERLKRDFDDPDDCEYSVNITAKQFRAIGRVLRDHQSTPPAKGAAKT